ncbi:unnamed protein product [Leuciscus chuanchicus]
MPTLPMPRVRAQRRLSDERVHEYPTRSRLAAPRRHSFSDGREGVQSSDIFSLLLCFETQLGETPVNCEDPQKLIGPERATFSTKATASRLTEAQLIAWSCVAAHALIPPPARVLFIFRISVSVDTFTLRLRMLMQLSQKQSHTLQLYKITWHQVFTVRS